MISPFIELIISYLNTRAKILTEDDIVIFFDKDEIINNIKKSWWKTSCFNSLKKAEKKLKKRNIEFYYYSQDELKHVNNNFRFRFNDDKIPKFNELYFKLNDYNDNVVKYYTYNNFLRFSEDYNYDYFVYLFSYFGLKSMRWSYTNSHDNTNQKNVTGNLGIRDHKNEFQFSTNETLNSSIGIEGCKNFENNGSHYFFDGCERRSFWYSYCKVDTDDIVKKILDKSKRYSYDYYLNNDSLQIRLDNRLRGAKQICYEITNNTHHKLIITKMIKISNNFSNLGIKLNSTNIDTKTYTKKYSINFWDIEDMELRTLEDILNDPEKYNHGINIDNANSRYKLLNDKNINDLNKELLILQEKIKNKNNRSSMRYSS